MALTQLTHRHLQRLSYRERSLLVVDELHYPVNEMDTVTSDTDGTSAVALALHLMVADGMTIVQCCSVGTASSMSLPLPSDPESARAGIATNFRSFVGEEDIPYIILKTN